MYISVSEVTDVEWDAPQERKLTCYTDDVLSEVVEGAECFPTVYKSKLLMLLREFRDIFSDQPDRINCYEHEIILHDYSSSFIKAYRIPHVYKGEVKRQNQEMEEWGVIRPCKTEYVSLLVAVKKKDGPFVTIAIRNGFFSLRISKRG